MITFLIASSDKELATVMKNVRKWAIGSKMKIYGSFFHSNNVPDKVVKRCLDLTSRRDIVATTIIVDKNDSIIQKIKENSHKFYNYLVGELFEICQQQGVLSSQGKHLFVASRRETNKNLNNDFVNYLKNKELPFFNGKIEYMISSPNQFKGLEVVDAIAFSIHQKYEYNILDLYSVIQDKIIIEKKISE